VGGIAVSFEDIKIIKVYAPSGAEKRRERETFYNIQVPIFLPSTPAEILLAGDFNCVLSHAGSTGQGN
jgi:exonuclease III